MEILINAPQLIYIKFIKTSINQKQLITLAK